MTAKVYAIAQQKGGVGKTTTARNLGAALVEDGARVLFVDLDPQAALTSTMGVIPEEIDLTVYNVLCDPAISVKKALQRQEQFCYIPANIDLAGGEVQLINEPGRESLLKWKLKEISQDFDYVLIDAPPSLGILTLNALVASTGVIIPVQTQYLALRGMDLLLSTIKKVQSLINPDLVVLGFLATMYDQRTKHSRECLENLKETYAEKVFRTVIPHTVKLQDSFVSSMPITQFDSNSLAAHAYRNLAKEIHEREA